MTESKLNTKNFEGKVDGKEVKLYVLKNKQGAEATILNYGAKIVSLCVPDKKNQLVDVVLGHNNLDEYLTSEEPYFGAICGRTGNRIENGKFTLDGVTYQLAINNGPNNLHGGLKGFNAVVWDANQIDQQTIELKYLSKDGEEGFPGNLSVTVTYSLSDDNALEIKYKATTDKATILNLTNHSYFNLSGAGDKSIHDHVVLLKASTYLPTDEVAIPLKDAENVKGTPFDFTTARTLGERINEDNIQLKNARGYDHTFVLNKKDGVENIGYCYSPKTGIVMTMFTSEPGVQVYTGNWMTGNFEGKLGQKYPAQSAVCFETQHFPNSINRPDYPSVVLRPEETFESTTIYKFSIEA